MKITIRLIASLRVGRFREEVREYPPGTRIGQIVKDLDLPEDHLGMALLNGRYADFESLPSDGDILSLLPLVGGG